MAARETWYGFIWIKNGSNGGEHGNETYDPIQAKNFSIS
jgi:hypothetical protein